MTDSENTWNFQMHLLTIKTYPFIRNVEEMSETKRSSCFTMFHLFEILMDLLGRPKRSNKIIDHFTCASVNVIYCKTCTYCKMFYFGETGRRLIDRFREHLRDVERNDGTHPNQSLDTLIFPIIPSSIHTQPTIPPIALTKG